jgi:hypothetical protein
MPDEIGNRAHLQPVHPCEFLQLRAARHAAIIVHDLAQHSHGCEPREPAEIHGRFGVTGAHQHAAAPRAQRKDVSGAREVRGRRARAGECADRGGAIPRGYPGRRTNPQIHGHGEGGTLRLAVDRHHLRQIESRQRRLFHGYADDAAGVPDHECHRHGGGMLGGHDEVAFVLAVFIVHDDHHASGTQLGEDLLHRVER